MKFLTLVALVIFATFPLQAGAAVLPSEAQEILNDLGSTPDVQQKNNNKLLQCKFRGTKKISVSLLENATVFSAEYLNCIEPGSTRDGYFEVIVRNNEIIGQSVKRSVNGELFDAAQVGDSEKVLELIRKKADVNYSETIPVTEGGDVERWTPLMSAAAAGNMSIVKQLVNAGAWINYMNSKFFNALWLASINGHLEVVKLLVANGAYVDNQSDDEMTPLMNAATYGHYDVAKYLVTRKAKLNLVHKDGDSALMLALANGHSDIARLLIASGANINIQNKFGVTPLHIAVAENNEAMVKLLIEEKADRLAKTDGGKTALDIAKARGDEKIIKLLQ